MTPRSPGASAPASRAIEVIGPPGAGKSTLAGALADHATEFRIVKRYRTARHLPYILPGGHAAAAVLRDPIGRSLTWRQLTWIARIESGLQMLERQSTRRTIIVFDQGPIYTLARLSDQVHGLRTGGTLGHWRNAKSRQLADLLDLVVVVDAPDSVLLERITARGKAHSLENMPIASGLAALADARASYDTLVSEVTGDHGPRVLRLDSSREALPSMVDEVLVALSADSGRRRAVGGPDSQGTPHAQ